jgi:glutamate N-acetyltransferase/amino-acid N-acetyltransferase
VTLNGFLKGSGMIAPDMATMLGFVFTDAKIPGNVLQRLLADAADKSLNCVTVDGDTSTSDTLLLAASGAARHAPIEESDDPVLVDFKRALDEVLIELAQLLARDGEGATKFVTINVGGASSNGAARKIGLAIANSPLVKTAIAGEDANWGRIVMAVGKSGERADRDRLRISIGGVRITDGGQVVPNYDEAPVARHIKGSDIVIDIDLGMATSTSTAATVLELRQRVSRRPAAARRSADGAGRSGGAGGRRWPRADRPAPAGKIDGGPVGVSRRQGRSGRDPRTGAGARTA